ncbi:hypothetical protein SALBM217S_01352 [Streptomyces griseoloalbus]
MSARPAATRRTVLRGAALTPVAGLGVTACRPVGDDRSAPPAGPVELGPESEVSAGCTELYREHNVVVGRGEDGSLTGYSTVCTHAGCPINKLDGTRRSARVTAASSTPPPGRCCWSRPWRR